MDNNQNLTLVAGPPPAAAPLFKQDDLFDKFKNEFNLTPSATPAINKGSTQELKLVGEIKASTSPYINTTTPIKKTKKIWSVEERLAQQNESIKINNECVDFLAKLKIEYPTIKNLPEPPYPNDSSAAKVKPKYVLKLVNEIKALAKKQIPQAEKDMAGLHTLAAKRTDNVVNEIIKDEEPEFEDLDKINASIGTPTGANIDIQPQIPVYDSIGVRRANNPGAPQPEDYAFFGTTVYKAELAAARIGRIRAATQGVDLSGTVQSLEDNREEITDAWQRLAIAYPDHQIVKALNDPWVAVFASHAPVAAAAAEDIYDINKKNQVVTS